MRKKPEQLSPDDLALSAVPEEVLLRATAKRYGDGRDAEGDLGPSPKGALPVVIHDALFKPFQPKRVKYNFQCDCACPDDGFRIAAPAIDWEQPLRSAATHRQDLGDGYLLHFAPVSERGVSVLNGPAEGVRRLFDRPLRLMDLGEPAGIRASAIALAELGVLEPADAPLRTERHPSKILSAWLHVTNECNLRCDYCYVRKTDEDMPEDVGEAAVDALFRSAFRFKFSKIKLKFAGGEATLNLKRVIAIHQYARRRSLETGIEVEATVLSNGVSIGPRAIEAFERDGMSVSISLDGIGGVHDAQRKFKNGAGSFRHVDRAIEKLIARGIRPFISITLSGRNAAGLADVVRYAHARDLPFNINFFRDNECARPFADLRLDEDRIIIAVREAFSVLEADLSERSLLGTLVDRAQFDQPHDKVCGVGDSYLVIDHKGNVAKCQMEIERPVTTVWSEDPLGLIRADQIGIRNLSVEEKEGCRECEWRYWCAGGCPAATFRATGRYDVKSPNCRIYKALYPEMLRLEGLRLLKLYRGHRGGH